MFLFVSEPCALAQESNGRLSRYLYLVLQTSLSASCPLSENDTGSPVFSELKMLPPPRGKRPFHRCRPGGLLESVLFGAAGHTRACSHPASPALPQGMWRERRQRDWLRLTGPWPPSLGQ